MFSQALALRIMLIVRSDHSSQFEARWNELRGLWFCVRDPEFKSHHKVLTGISWPGLDRTRTRDGRASHEPYRRRLMQVPLLVHHSEEATSTIAPGAPLTFGQRKAWATTSQRISPPSRPRSLHIHHSPCFLCTNPATRDERTIPLTNSHTCHTGLHAKGVPCR